MPLRKTGNFLISILLTIAFIQGFTFASKASHCPMKYYQCGRERKCLPRSTICDGHIDCEDGLDEFNCRDEFDDEYWNQRYPKRPDADRETEHEVCRLPYHPNECDCKDTRLYCNNKNLHGVPEKLPPNVTVLDLSSNDISVLSMERMRKLPVLEELICIESGLKKIEKRTFVHNKKLKKLYLQANELSYFDNCTFCGCGSLAELDISSNKFKAIDGVFFEGLQGLTKLNLQRNEIESIRLASKTYLDSLRIIDLGYNKLSQLTVAMLSLFRNVNEIMVNDNAIRHIQDGAFRYHRNLRRLGLSNNKIAVITRHMFDDMTRLRHLVLRQNDIGVVQKGAFNSMPSLFSLNLKGNSLSVMPDGVFDGLHNLTHVYFDRFQLCYYAMRVPMCEPKGDGISSHRNLLENDVLRVFVWVVATLSCIANGVVLLGRFLINEPNKMHSFFIKNLSMADLLMGIYLFIIASRDVMYRGNYLTHEYEWRIGWQCDACGFLSTVSSEVSVMILATITLDRYMCVMHPLIIKRRSLKSAYFITAIIWIVSIFLALLPIVGIPYFGEHYYSNNGVCLPLHIHDPFGEGWEYSAFVFIGINFTACIFVSYSYSAMFYVIRSSRLCLRSSQANQETSLARRFAFIVFSDFFCWVPIFVIKIIALSGVKISGNLYAWVAIFVLPVNSALNPILYTLTTRLFKQQLVQRMYRVCWRAGTCRPEVTDSSSSSDFQRPRYVPQVCQKDQPPPCSQKALAKRRLSFPPAHSAPAAYPVSHKFSPLPLSRQHRLTMLNLKAGGKSDFYLGVETREESPGDVYSEIPYVDTDDC